MVLSPFIFFSWLVNEPFVHGLTPREEGQVKLLAETPNGLSAPRYCENCRDIVKKVSTTVIIFLVCARPPRARTHDLRSDFLALCHKAPRGIFLKQSGNVPYRRRLSAVILSSLQMLYPPEPPILAPLPQSFRQLWQVNPVEFGACNEPKSHYHAGPLLNNK